MTRNTITLTLSPEEEALRALVKKVYERSITDTEIYVLGLEIVAARAKKPVHLDHLRAIIEEKQAEVDLLECQFKKIPAKMTEDCLLTTIKKGDPVCLSQPGNVANMARATGKTEAEIRDLIATHHPGTQATREASA